MQRFFEILPGALSWLTIFLMVFFSWKLPFFVALFIILFDIYWLLKTVYFSFHLRYTFAETRKNLKIDWLQKLKETHQHSWEDIYHLIILPMYHEPHTVVRESFLSLTKANYPKEKFIVVLATEERGGDDDRETAKKIQEEFGDKFFRFLITKHPSALPEEIPGKGSNETWAGQEAKRLLIDPLLDSTDASTLKKVDDVLASVFDVDTQIFPDYFGRLTYVFLATGDRLRAIYQPIPLFINNVYQAPLLSRLAAFSTTFWQMMQQARPERLTTFSSQSIPLQVLAEVGFWQKDIVSEDSRIFWQCYLHYHGNFRVVPLFYFVSMDVNAGRSFWESVKNLYRQQRRWAWGCENIPYLLGGLRRDPLIPKNKKYYWSFHILEGFHSWATNSLMIFALGWLPVILGGRGFNTTLLSYSLPKFTGYIIDLSMFSIVSLTTVSMLLLPPRPAWFKTRHYLLYALQWAFLPVTLVVFGSLPALEAQTRLALGGKWRLGFWTTPKHRA